MSAIRFLAAVKLAPWLAEVAASRQVLAPRQEGKAVVFRPLVAGETPSLARATVSPKAAVFPACETLIRFTGTKDPENPAKLDIKLDDTPDAPARMVFGCRSCDARGFAVLDKPFLQGKFQDAYYKARRDSLLVVAHGNSLRGVIKHLKGIPDDRIAALNLPTAVPYVFEFDDALRLVRDYYLGDPEEIRRRAEAVARQGSAR